MAVNLSPVGGAAAQFFTNSGTVLTGGKLYTYAAGTTTPQTTYTTLQGNVAWTNPIVLNAAGRVPNGGEIWLTDTVLYKFVLKDSNDVLIATYDNITGINGTGLATNATNVEYDPPFTGAVTSGYSVANKLSQYISLKDFGAVGDGSTDDTAAIQAAITASYGNTLYVPEGTYLISSTITIAQGLTIVGSASGSVFKAAPNKPLTTNMFETTNSLPSFAVVGLTIENITFDGASLAPQRWLQNSSGVAITNPEADYVAGTGALASGITGVSLTAVLTGNVVTSVTINTGGSGWNGHPTYPYVPSEVRLIFSGGGGFGAAGTATISGGTLTAITLTSGGYGYTSPPTVTTAGGYASINLLVQPSVNRRNPNYTQVSQLIDLVGTLDSTINNCRFINHYGRAVYERGGVNATISNCYFDTIGKNDGPYWCLATTNQGLYPSTNTKILNNYATNLERSFCNMSPYAGGIAENNYIDGWQESCFFVQDNVNSAGGTTTIKNNTMKNGVVSDIVGQGVEFGASSNLIIEGNTIFNSQDSAMVTAGSTNCQVKNNVFKNCFEAYTEPYGPFSERYAFNVNQPPTAGRQNGYNLGSVIQIGITTSSAGNNLQIKGNTFIEDRASYPNVFLQTKSGTGNRGKTTVIEGNTLSVPSGMVFLDTTIGNVWENNIPLFIRNNTNHASNAPVVISDSYTATPSTKTITVGFRPSKVDVYMTTTVVTDGRSAVGTFTWNLAATRNDFSLTTTTNVAASYNRAGIQATDVARLVDSSGTTTFLLEFSSWSELGFVLANPTASEAVNVRYVCYP